VFVGDLFGTLSVTKSILFEATVYKAKTRPTDVGVASYLAAIEDDTRRKDCKEIASVMERATGCAARMWGTGIVGFDSYHYRYESGHEGDSCIVGFSSRKGDIGIYLIPGYEAPETKALLSQLGKHKTGKACLYIKRLSDIHLPVLEQLVARAVVETKRRYPAAKK